MRIRVPRVGILGGALIALPLAALPLTALPADAAAKPVVTKVVATHGSTNGGTVVTVTGKNFTKVSAVKFGSIKGAHVKVVSSEKVTVTSPKHTAGVVHVRIVTKAGTSAAVKTDHFTYATPPSVTKISPTRGLVKGGTKVTVTGKNFAGATKVTVGQTAVDYRLSSGKIILTTPPHMEGRPDIRVSNLGGTSKMAAADKFTFVSPPVPKPLPVLREIFTQGDPLASGIAGGTHVYIDATYTGKINAVSFGGVDAPIQYVRDSTGAIVDWYVLAPKHPAGTVHVQVTDDNGTSLPTVADKFRYYPPPVVTGLSVTSGPARGGTNVTVLGSFHGPLRVTFDGSGAVASLQTSTATTVVAVSPLHATGGVVHVQVKDLGGLSEPIEADEFTYIYYPPPVITALSPASGPTTGGTHVVLRDSFHGEVAIASAGYATYDSDTDTYSVETPAHAAGIVDVWAKDIGAPSTATSETRFTYTDG